MDLNRFTEKMQEALQSAQSRAIRRSHQQLDVEHLLAALVEQESGLAGAILAKAGASAELLGQRLEQELDGMPKVTGPTGAPPDQIYVTGRLNRVLTLAEDEAKKLKGEYVAVEHVLLAITEDKGPAGRLLAQMGVTRDKLMQALREVRGSQRVTSPTPEATYQALERYGRDLTEAARQGKLDPVIGRDDEIRRVIQVLSRRTKNNPVLIGEPGVGKTAIVEGLAQRIVDGDVPESLQDKRVVALDIGAPVAGAKYRAELEERFELPRAVGIEAAAVRAAPILRSRYVTGRFLPDKAIDLIDEAASRLRIEIDSMPVEIDEVERRIKQLEIERAALKKETDQASKERLAKLEQELAELRERSEGMKAHWQQEKQAIDRIRALKSE